MKSLNILVVSRELNIIQRSLKSVCESVEAFVNFSTGATRKSILEEGHNPKDYDVLIIDTPDDIVLKNGKRFSTYCKEINPNCHIVGTDVYLKYLKEETPKREYERIITISPFNSEEVQKMLEDYKQQKEKREQ